jgi:hypothetical protein
LKNIKYIWTAIVILLSIYIINNIRTKGKKSYESFYGNEINGIIDSIYYGDKTQAIIKIKNKEYSLFLFNIRKGDDLNKGDSLYKGKNSKELELHSKTKNGNFINTENFKLR